MRDLPKKKISANIDPYVLRESLRISKKLGYRSFSSYIESALRSVISDKEILIALEYKQANSEMMHWRDLLSIVQEEKQNLKEERFPSNPSKEEEVI